MTVVITGRFMPFLNSIMYFIKHIFYYYFYYVMLFAVFTHHSTVMPSIFLLTISAKFHLSISRQNVPSIPRTLITPLLLINHWGTPMEIHSVQKALTKSHLHNTPPFLQSLLQYVNLLLLFSHQAEPQLGRFCLVTSLTQKV